MPNQCYENFRVFNAADMILPQELLAAIRLLTGELVNIIIIIIIIIIAPSLAEWSACMTSSHKIAGEDRDFMSKMKIGTVIHKLYSY